MTAPTPSKCRACQSSVFWAKTFHGKKIALDAEPSPKGTMELTVSQSTGELKAKRAIYPGRDNVKLRTCHFETCPEKKRAEP